VPDLSHNRVLRATPERVAFLDPEAMAKWLPPNGFTGKVHQLDAEVGGMLKSSTTARIRNRRPSESVSDRKSRLQR
jgi:uncharacterized protein YndB with AHSA1/START domain